MFHFLVLISLVSQLGSTPVAQASRFGDISPDEHLAECVRQLGSDEWQAPVYELTIDALDALKITQPHFTIPLKYKTGSDVVVGAIAWAHPYTSSEALRLNPDQLFFRTLSEETYQKYFGGLDPVAEINVRRYRGLMPHQEPEHLTLGSILEMDSKIYVVAGKGYTESIKHSTRMYFPEFTVAEFDGLPAPGQTSRVIRSLHYEGFGDYTLDGKLVREKLKIGEGILELSWLISEGRRFGSALFVVTNSRSGSVDEPRPETLHLGGRR